MFLEDIENWLHSLQSSEQLRVFQSLSEYLSVNELKNVMLELEKGSNLLTIHSQMGLIRKYQVDLIRIYNSKKNKI